MYIFGLPQQSPRAKRCLGSLLVMMSAFSVGACSELGDNVSPSKSSNQTLGTVTFWSKTDLGRIEIYLNNRLQGTIAHYHSQGVACGSGDVNSKAEAGVYDLSAKSSNGKSWTGTVSF